MTGRAARPAGPFGDPLHLFEEIMPVLFLLPAWMIQGPQEAEERFYRFRRREFDRMSGALDRAGRAYARRKDYEVALVAWSLASETARDPAEVDRRARDALRRLRLRKKPFRTNPVGLTETTRALVPVLSRVIEAAAASGVTREEAGLGALALQLRSAGTTLDVLRALNDFRRAAGLLPVGLSPALSRGCALHLRYIRETGRVVRRERKESRFHTAEGARAGRSAFLAKAPGPIRAVEGMLSLAYARVPVLNPGLEWIGACTLFRKKELLVMIDAPSDPAGQDGLVVFPPPGLRHAARSYGLGLYRDRPSPVPRQIRNPGLPVTLIAYGDTRRTISGRNDIRAALFDPWGREVRCVRSFPARPAHPRARENHGAIVLLPAEPLRKNTTYRAVFEIPARDGTRRILTEFTTGEQ